MTPFALERAVDAADAATRFAAAPGAHYIAGGTAVVDLMQLGVQAPARLVEILDLRDSWAAVEVDAEGATIGALATMAEVAAHPAIRARWAAAAQALDQAASPQIRNTATVGGTLLQRTRCSGFRDAASACNKRQPGAGCAAHAGGQTRDLAVLGTSPHCIANYPGDLAVALVALDARLTLLDPDGASPICASRSGGSPAGPGAARQPKRRCVAACSTARLPSTPQHFASRAQRLMRNAPSSSNSAGA